MCVDVGSQEKLPNLKFGLALSGDSKDYIPYTPPRGVADCETSVNKGSIKYAILDKANV